MSWVFVGILGALAALAAPVLVIVLVVRAGRRGRGLSSPGAPVRRFFQYGLLFAAFIMVSAGAAGLAQSAFESAPIAGRGRVAGPLALLIVGGPLFGILGAWTRSKLASDPGERLSIGWLLYVTFALVTSLVVALYGAMETLGWAIGSRDAGSGAAAIAVVWGLGWLAHWRVARAYLPADDARSHRLIGSLITLVTALGSVIALGAIAATWAYDEITGRALASTIDEDIRSLAGPVLVSVAAWSWYWLRSSRKMTPTIGWNAYVLLAGVLVGVLVVVTSAGVGLYIALEWMFGQVAGGAVDHFADVPGIVVAAGVGMLTWFYHREVFRDANVEAAPDVSRMYAYLLAAVGLIASTAGSTALLSALFEAIGGARDITGDGVGTGVLAGLTLLAVGLPIWWVAWSGVHRSGRDEAEERTSLARRLYLSGSFGLGGVVAVIALLAVAATFFEHLLDGDLGATTLVDTRGPLALVVTVGFIAAYHWRVFRADRSAAPAKGRGFDHIVLVVPGDGTELSRAITERTGARVEVWELAEGSPPDVAAVIGAVDGLTGRQGIIVADADGASAFDAQRA